MLALAKNDPAMATGFLREALTASGAEADESVAAGLARLAAAFERDGDLARAEEAASKTWSTFSQLFGDRDERTMRAGERAAVLRMRLGKPGAGSLLASVLAGAEFLHGTDSPATAEVLGWVALAALADGRATEAQAAAERRQRILAQVTENQRGHLSAESLATWTAARGVDAMRACQAIAEAPQLAARTWGETHPLTRGVAAASGQLLDLAASPETGMASARREQ